MSNKNNKKLFENFYSRLENENLKLFEEWNKFQITSTLIKTKKYKKAISNIIQHPFNINKLKLLIMLTFPRAISKIIISET